MLVQINSDGTDCNEVIVCVGHLMQIIYLSEHGGRNNFLYTATLN